ncbi:MAG TPA: hypothetical protein VJ441_02770 [Dehalococcoidia bacterium]|nr:hypothetical protein [Dehalococcoidia bacterium]
MPKTRKTWREKLEGEQGLPKIVDVTPKMAGRFGTEMGDRLLIPKPLDVDALIRQVEKGRLITVTQIREKLARDFNADVTCPLTTGIFIRTAAEVAEEDLSRGEKQITPYWRVIKENGGLNEKFPGGAETQAARLREEGHSIEPGKGRKPPRVKDFEKFLQKL